MRTEISIKMWYFYCLFKRDLNSLFLFFSFFPEFRKTHRDYWLSLIKIIPEAAEKLKDSGWRWLINLNSDFLYGIHWDQYFSISYFSPLDCDFDEKIDETYFRQVTWFFPSIFADSVFVGKHIIFHTKYYSKNGSLLI